jgi:hypothetical protein
MTTLDLSHIGITGDLTWLVERVSRNGLPWVMVSSAAVARWQGQDPEGWSNVVRWLDAQGVTLVRI